MAKVGTSTKQKPAVTGARMLDGAATVIVVQLSEPDPLPPSDIDTFVAVTIAAALASTKSRPKDGDAWVFLLATDRAHAEELHTWVGFIGVPTKVIDLVQSIFERRGCRAGRESAVIAHHALRPLLAVTKHGIEISPRTTSPDDATLEIFHSDVTRRPFTIDLDGVFKKDQLSTIMLGMDAKSVFRLRYFEHDEAATFRFGRVDLQMFIGHGDGSYTAMTKHTETPPCLLSFEFTAMHLAQLDAMLEPHVSTALSGMLDERRPFRVPSGTVTVGVQAHIAGPGPDGTTEFVVEAFSSAGDAFLVVEF